MSTRPEHANLSVAADLKDVASTLLELANRATGRAARNLTVCYKRTLSVRNQFIDGAIGFQTARDFATAAQTLAHWHEEQQS